MKNKILYKSIYDVKSFVKFLKNQETLLIAVGAFATFLAYTFNNNYPSLQQITTWLSFASLMGLLILIWALIQSFIDDESKDFFTVTFKWLIFVFLTGMVIDLLTKDIGFDLNGFIEKNKTYGQIYAFGVYFIGFYLPNMKLVNKGIKRIFKRK